MTSGRWQRIQELIEAVLDISPAQRTAFLGMACADDPTLRQQVQDLVHADEQAGSFLDAAVKASAIAALPAPPQTGDRIGPYRITSTIGQGGMGVVYGATRADQHFDQQVAIKLVRTGLAGTPEALARLRFERQFLANLNHPNISRLLDGGATEDGSPYVVMEYVPGRAIDLYCAEQALPVRERLRLFQKVADAVQYAHQNLIIHRDIKPANVLVTEAGEPKLLDFGIAKIMSEDRQFPALTQAGDRLLTPQYASPEQIRGGSITTSTDIYSLGALLYALLAGKPPFSTEDAGFGQMEREICERIPEKPSSAAGSAELRGDLDRIVMKALHKEPQRRYVSAAEFSADIERYRNGFPVAARPDSWRYRAGKFVRRHRLGVAASMVFMASVIAFGIGMAVLGRRAQEEARTASQVTEFLVNLFDSNDPGQTKGENVTTRQLLDRATLRIDSQLKNDPVVQARLFDTVGSLYDSLGVWPEAERLIKKALYLRQHRLARDDLAIANTLHELGGISADLNLFSQAESSYREALRLYRSKLGAESGKTAASLDDLGLALFLEGRLAEAEKLDRQSLEMNTRVSGAKSVESLRALHNLACTLRHLGQYSESEHLFRQYLPLAMESGGRLQDSVGYGWHNLSLLLDQLGRWAEAETAAREAIAIRAKLYGQDHPLSAVSEAVLSHILMRAGKLDEAEGLAAAALAEVIKMLGLKNFDTAYTQDCVGSVLLAKGDPAGARVLFQSAYDERFALVGGNNPLVADSLMNLGTVDRAVGDLPAAANRFQRALEIRDGAFGPGNVFSAESEVALAGVYSGQGKAKRAEDLARRALLTDRSGLPARNFNTGAAESALGWAYCQQRRTDDARPLLAEASSIARTTFGPNSVEAVREAALAKACGMSVPPVSQLVVQPGLGQP